MAWGNGQHDDGVFGDDGLGDPSADCFGRCLEDIDPFGRSDSFDRDPDWMAGIASDKTAMTGSKMTSRFLKSSRNDVFTAGEGCRRSNALHRRTARSNRSSRELVSRTDKPGCAIMNGATPSVFGTVENILSAEGSDFDPFSIGLDRTRRTRPCPQPSPTNHSNAQSSRRVMSAPSPQSQHSAPPPSLTPHPIARSFRRIASMPPRTYSVQPSSTSTPPPQPQQNLAPPPSPTKPSIARSSRRLMSTPSLQPQQNLAPPPSPTKPSIARSSRRLMSTPSAQPQQIPESPPSPTKPSIARSFRRIASLPPRTSVQPSTTHLRRSTSPRGRHTEGVAADFPRCNDVRGTARSPSKYHRGSSFRHSSGRGGSPHSLAKASSSRRLLRNEQRRSAVTDALRSTLAGHEADDVKRDVPLSSFLSSDSDSTSRGSAPRAGGEIGSVSGTSIQSAPVTRRRRQSRERPRERNAVSPASTRASRSEHSRLFRERNPVSPTSTRASRSEHSRLCLAGSSGSSSPGAGSKSRRQISSRTLQLSAPPPARERHRRRQSVPAGGGGGGGTMPRADATVSIDVAHLAERGYIEVVDGKMRLVVDLDDT